MALGVRTALTRRVEAVRTGDRERFLAGVVGDRAAFLAQQAAYFDNLVALPLARFDLAPDAGSLVRDGRGYWIEVDVTLQLAGYDDAPVTTRDRYRFSATRAGRFLLTSTTARAWEQQHDVTAQPWDTGPVTVVDTGSVLGIFDAGSAHQADAVVADVRAGVDAVQGEVPYEWDGRVVVYAPSDGRFLADVEGLPNDPLAVDAVTFPVRSRPGGARVASVRFVLNPRVLATPGPSRRRLVRHELTHVALGERQDGAPTWFSEGLAEYVSVRALAPAQRAVSAAALAAAERGLDGLPSHDDFRGPATEASYGIAWWACEYLARSYGESMLWVLLDSMSSRDGADRVLQRVLGIDEATLARKAGRLLLDTYRPTPARDPEPSRSPSDRATAQPSEDPPAGPSQDEPGEPTESPRG